MYLQEVKEKKRKATYGVLFLVRIMYLQVFLFFFNYVHLLFFFQVFLKLCFSIPPHPGWVSKMIVGVCFFFRGPLG